MNFRQKMTSIISLISVLITIHFCVQPMHIKTQPQILDDLGYSITTQLPEKAPLVPQGQTFIEINNNVPFFTNADITASQPWIKFSRLDELGRVGAANAVLSTEFLPANQESEKDSIQHILPTGWHQGRYKHISSGGWLYNRSHLLGYQLIGNGIPELNLMTGTRWLNLHGMLPFENFVANTIENEEILVRYRVTPFFEGGNLLASGVFMEGFSIDDNGNTLQFNIFIPNRQDNIYIDYGTGLHDSEFLEQTLTNKVAHFDHPGTELFTIKQNDFEENIFLEEQPRKDSLAEVYYENCTAVRQAGAAPLKEGDPGYSKRLDRDNDGIACE